MMSSVLYVAAAAILLAQNGSPAAPSPSPAPAVIAPAAPATPAATPDGDKIICKTIETTGSRFSTRECATKDQWAERTRQARDFVDANTRLGHCPNNMC
jgi:cytochrome c5